jgi:hypothetical protein
MIEESQLLFLHAASGTLSTKTVVKDNLTYHIQDAKYARFYDGFMGGMTIDVLKGLGVHGAYVICMPATIPNNRQTIYIKSNPRSIKQIEGMRFWATEIGTYVAAGKKVIMYNLFKREPISGRSCIRSCP